LLSDYACDAKVLIPTYTTTVVRVSIIYSSLLLEAGKPTPSISAISVASEECPESYSATKDVNES
jgi:hypothetical protein